MEIKFKPREFGMKDKTKATFIVGLSPNKQRKKDTNGEVFHGNKIGDLVEESIKGKENIFLTNVTNTYVSDRELSAVDITKGLVELKEDLKKYKPKKVIALGASAAKQIEGLAKEKDIVKFSLVKEQHPSYVLRFNKGVVEYKKKLKESV